MLLVVLVVMELLHLLLELQSHELVAVAVATEMVLAPVVLVELVAALPAVRDYLQQLTRAVVAVVEWLSVAQEAALVVQVS
jgi:hypothetical protein